MGQRWIESVAVRPGDASVMALCTHADGKANDFPTVFIRGAQTTTLPPQADEYGFRSVAFHYGDHSNHLGMRALNYAAVGMWVCGGERALWHANAQTTASFSLKIPCGDAAVSTSAAALPTGELVMGLAVPIEEGKHPADKAYVLKPGMAKPLWSRAPLLELPAVPAAEKCLYGAPTSRLGQKIELAQWDVPVVGPLSIALHAGADHTLERIATADYRGWQRWVVSSATRRNQNIGTRMMPGRPVVSVYDAKGALVRRIAADRFLEPAWLDLRFFPDGKRLVAWPHRWTSRGLGGKPEGFARGRAEARAIYISGHRNRWRPRGPICPTPFPMSQFPARNCSFRAGMADAID